MGKAGKAGAEAQLLPLLLCQTWHLEMIWLLIYTAAMMGACFYHADRQADSVAYYVCGRKARAPAVAFSILASCIGGSATIGMAGLAWECGAPAFWWLGSGSIGLALLSVLLAKKIRTTRELTLPGVIFHFLGANCKTAAAAIVLVSSVAIIAAQFSALGLMIAPLLQTSEFTAICAGSVFLTIYTFIGGQQAVIRSDIWQLLLLLLALCLILCLLLAQPACLAAVRSLKLELSNAALPAGRVAYYMIIFGMSFLIGPMIFGRLLSADSPDSAQKGSLWAAIGMAGAAALITCLGVALQGIPMEPPKREDALFLGIATALPPWAQICAILGLASAVISSADSCLMTAATVCASGLLKHGNVPFTRICMCLISAASLLLAVEGKGILALLLASSDIYVCGVVPALFVAVLAGQASARWRRLYLAAMVTGGCLGFSAAISGERLFSYLGVTIAFTLSLAAAWASAREKRHGSAAAINR